MKLPFSDILKIYSQTASDKLIDYNPFWQQLKLEEY